MYPIDVTKNKRTSANALSNSKAYLAFVIDLSVGVFVFFLILPGFRGTFLYPLLVILDIVVVIFVGWAIFAKLIVREDESLEEFESYKSNVLPKCWHITNREYIGNNIFELDNGNAFILVEIKFKSISVKNKKQMESFFNRFYKFIFDNKLKVQTITITEDYSRSNIFDKIEKIYNSCENKRLISFLMEILNHVRDIAKYEGKLPALYLRIEGAGYTRSFLQDVLDYIDTENRNETHGLRVLQYLDRQNMYAFLQQYLNLDVLDVEMIYRTKNDNGVNNSLVYLCGYDDEIINDIPDVKLIKQIDKKEECVEDFNNKNKYLNRLDRVVIGKQKE